jgi:hypothetical protein
MQTKELTYNFLQKMHRSAHLDRDPSASVADLIKDQYQADLVEDIRIYDMMPLDEFNRYQLIYMFENSLASKTGFGIDEDLKRFKTNYSSDINGQVFDIIRLIQKDLPSIETIDLTARLMKKLGIHPREDLSVQARIDNNMIRELFFDQDSKICMTDWMSERNYSMVTVASYQLVFQVLSSHPHMRIFTPNQAATRKNLLESDVYHLVRSRQKVYRKTVNFHMLKTINRVYDRCPGHKPAGFKSFEKAQVDFFNSHMAVAVKKIVDPAVNL